MRQQKKKTVTIEVRGTEFFFEPTDPEGVEIYDAFSRFSSNGLVITVDGKKYSQISFGLEYNILTQEQLEEFKMFNAAEFFEESGAKEGMLYKNKAWTSIEIEINEKKFDPNKVALIQRGLELPDGSIEPSICAFGYDGKVYDCAPGDSEGISGKKIWPCDKIAESNDELVD